MATHFLFRLQYSKLVSMAMNLKNQVAIISGGLGDIGRAIALELSSRGAAVAVSDVLPPQEAEALLRELGKASRYDRVDVSDCEAVEAWIKQVEQALGTPTLIIPNAAIVTQATLRALSPQQWRRELSINLDGAYCMANAAALRLVASKTPGRIVFIGSWAGHAPHPVIPAYSVAKAGLRMLMKLMAAEYANAGILVNEVAPGYVDAGLSGKIFDESPGAREKATQRVPIKKLIKAEEVAYEVAHLCDPLNQHTTGSVCLMDGGLSLKRGGYAGDRNPSIPQQPDGDHGSSQR